MICNALSLFTYCFVSTVTSLAGRWPSDIEDDSDDIDLALFAFKECNFPYPVDVARDGAEALDLRHGRRLNKNQGESENEKVLCQGVSDIRGQGEERAPGGD